MKPPSKAPTLISICGSGTRLYGKSDYDPATDSYLATLFFTIAFLPIFPLGKYRVSKIDYNKYKFIDAKPLSIKDWRSPALLFILVSLMILSNIIGNGYHSKKPTVDKYELKKEIEEAKLDLEFIEKRLNKMQDAIKNYKMNIDKIDAEIDLFANNQNIKNKFDKDRYDKLVKKYNYYIELYNKELVDYKKEHNYYKELLERTNNKIKLYNEN